MNNSLANVVGAAEGGHVTNEVEQAEDVKPIEDIIDRVKAAIRAANIGHGGESLAVTALELTLRVCKVRVAGGAVEWKVPIIGLTFKGGAKLTQEDVDTLTVKLVPPPPDVEEAREGLLTGKRIEEELAHAIANIRRAIMRAAQGEPVFELGDASVEIEFAVTKEGTLSLIAAPEAKNEVTHTMKLSLGKSAT